MTVAELLNIAKAEGITLQPHGARLTWSADHQPPSELLAELALHKMEIIETLSAANDHQECYCSWRIHVSGYHPFTMIGEPMTEIEALKTAHWHWPNAQVHIRR